jgi:hypothetical protein
LLFINVYFNTEYTEGTERKSERRNGRGGKETETKASRRENGKKGNIR